MAELRVHPTEITPQQILPFIPKAAKIDQRKDQRLAAVAKILAECSGVHAAATAVMQLEPWDFMAVYYDTIDHFCHGYMKYHPPRLPWIGEEDFELYKDVINTAYQFHDMMLGTLMKLAGDDTTIIIVSDHGFHPDHLRPKELPNEPAGAADEHRPFGMFAAMGPGIKKDELVFGANLLDITPTVLTLFDLPVGRDMDGKPLTNVLESQYPTYIDSWDDVPGDDGCHPADIRVDPVDTSESMQQLVDLGYIDELDDDQQKVTENTVRELRYNLARDLMDAQHYDKAILLFDELWEFHTDESRFGLKLFECFLVQKKTVEARQTLDKITERKAQSSVSALEDLQQLQEANKDKQPEDVDERTVRQIQKLQRRTSTNVATMAYLRGRLFSVEGLYEEALAEFKKAENIQLHNHPSLFQMKGDVLMALRRWDEATSTFKNILEIDPVNPSAQIGLCRCYLAQRGKVEKALKAGMACLGLTYHHPRAHFLCGVALQRLGRARDAQRAFETAIAQNPIFPAAHRRLARLYRLPLGDPDKANEHIVLARAAAKRITAFRSGEEPPTPAVAQLDANAAASLSDLACNDELGPLPEDGIVVVSGLPRSGTSMMMQMLEAGGLPILTDEVRTPDEDNPKGYYEYEGTKKLATDNGWLKAAPGKAVKIIAQLLPGLRQGFHYRILFMERPIQEVIASQSVMLERLGRRGGRLSDQRLAETYFRQIDSVRNVLNKHKKQVSVLSINYHLALKDPVTIARSVNRFLGGGLDEEAMVTVIDPDLRRQCLR
jgi:tetratricopeptide (TPR) repeat protein